MNIHLVRFSGLPALADAAERAGDPGSDPSWANATFAEALQLARQGWPAGAEQARRLVPKLSLPTVASAAPIVATYNDVTGAYVDIGAFVSGEPECMVDFAQDTRQAPVVKLVFVGCYSGACGRNTIVRRGCAIAALVDSLEARGVRCDVEVQVNVRGTTAGDTYEHRVHVTVKRAEQALDLDALVFAAGHPAFWRHLVKAIQTIAPPLYRAAGAFNGGGYGGWGAGASWTHTVADDSNTITLPGLMWDTSFASDDKAMAFVEALVTKHSKGA